MKMQDYNKLQRRNNASIMPGNWRKTEKNERKEIQKPGGGEKRRKEKKRLEDRRKGRWKVSYSMEFVNLCAWVYRSGFKIMLTKYSQLCRLWRYEWSSRLIRNLSNCEREAWKKFRLQRDSNPWPLRYRCSALPTELWSHNCWEQVNFSGSIMPLRVIQHYKPSHYVGCFP